MKQICGAVVLMAAAVQAQAGTLTFSGSQGGVLFSGAFNTFADIGALSSIGFLDIDAASFHATSNSGVITNLNGLVFNALTNASISVGTTFATASAFTNFNLNAFDAGHAAYNVNPLGTGVIVGNDDTATYQGMPVASFTYNYSAATAPEPSSYAAAMLGGLLLVAGWRRSRREGNQTLAAGQSFA